MNHNEIVEGLKKAEAEIFAKFICIDIKDLNTQEEKDYSLIRKAELEKTWKFIKMLRISAEKKMNELFE